MAPGQVANPLLTDRDKCGYLRNNNDDSRHKRLRRYVALNRVIIDILCKSFYKLNYILFSPIKAAR